ncbi:MAG: AIR synthase-related protein, partial [Kovacikia sp.]
LGKDQTIKIYPDSWVVLPIFHWLAAAGEVSLSAMFNTFNMGIGFTVLVAPGYVTEMIHFFEAQNISAYAIGEVITGSGKLVGLPE